jgi:hypothetical protein
MKVTYCDICGNKIVPGEKLYIHEVRTSIPASFALKGKLEIDVKISIDVLPKQYDVCSFCRIEAVNNAINEINKRFK